MYKVPVGNDLLTGSFGILRLPDVKTSLFNSPG